MKYVNLRLLILSDDNVHVVADLHVSLVMKVPRLLCTFPAIVLHHFRILLRFMVVNPFSFP